MRKKYEEKFNSPDSKVLVNESWERYMIPKGNDILVRKRYDYSIMQLYGDVLDVGSGDGFGAYLMSKNPKINHITCLEIQDKAIEKAKKNLKEIENITIVKGIGEEIPLNKKFDSIHCGSTLEHSFDDRKVLTEIKRLLKGKAVISVPIHGGISLQHIREYKTKDDFLNLLKEYFEIISYRMFLRTPKEKSIVATVKHIKEII